MTSGTAGGRSAGAAAAENEICAQATSAQPAIRRSREVEVFTARDCSNWGKQAQFRPWRGRIWNVILAHISFTPPFMGVVERALERLTVFNGFKGFLCETRLKPLKRFQCLSFPLTHPHEWGC